MNHYDRSIFELAPLYHDMKATGKGQEQFEFAIANLTFEVIFLVDRVPFELLVGVVGTQIAFVLSVEKGFVVSTIPDAAFYLITQRLVLSPGVKTFTSWSFLDRLAKSIPQKCSKKGVEPHMVARFKQAQLYTVPEGDRIYFVGWNNHLADMRIARNIEKTRLLCGDSIADFCEKNNISSMWSNRPHDAHSFKPPLDYSSH